MSYKKTVLTVIFIASLFFSATPFALAAECSLSVIEPDAGGQNWNVTYCVTSNTEAEAKSIASVKATCREAPSGAIVVDALGNQNCSCYYDANMSPTVRPDLYSVCNSVDANLFTPPAPPASTEKPISITKVVEKGDGTYLTCFTLTSLDRNMGKIDVAIKNASGSTVCPVQTTDVTPGNYGGAFEYFQNTVATRTNLVPTYSPPINQASSECQNIVGSKGINTALGCISFDAVNGGFVRSILSIAIGLGGGFALLIILYGVFTLTTSAGIPDKIKVGQELISSAVAGLIFIILAIFMMNLIGIKILAIPGLQ